MAREKENDFFFNYRKAWLSVLAACEGVSEPIQIKGGKYDTNPADKEIGPNNCLPRAKLFEIIEHLRYPLSENSVLTIVKGNKVESG